MAIIMVGWYILGIIALLFGNKDKKSIAVETLEFFTKQKSGMDVFEGIMMILVGWPIIIALGPITLIRFIL